MSLTFDNAPIVGETMGNYIWDGEKWALNVAGNSGGIPDAPNNGKQYGRQSNSTHTTMGWTEIPNINGIGFLPRLHLTGYKPAVTSGVLSIGPGVCADANGTELLYNTTNLLIDPGSNFGNLCLDKGQVQNGMGYFVYILRNQIDKSQAGAVLSTSRFTTPSPTRDSQTFTAVAGSNAFTTPLAHGFDPTKFYIVTLTNTGINGELPAGLYGATVSYYLHADDAVPPNLRRFRLSETLHGPFIAPTTAGIGVHSYMPEYVEVPPGWDLWRKLPFGLVWLGKLPSHHISYWPATPHIRYTEASELAAWRVLTSGSATLSTFTPIDLTQLVPDNAHMVYLRCVLSGTVAGDAWLNTPSTGTTGFRVAHISASGDVFTGYHYMASTSERLIEYKVSSASLNLDVYVIGYDQTENS